MSRPRAFLRLPRRRFLAGLPGITWFTRLQPLAAAPLSRKGFHISGISLAAYSLRSEFAVMRGKATGGTLQMPGFLDYCASIGLSGAELTSYFFPEDIDLAYCRRIKRQAHLLGIDLTGGAIGNNFSFPPDSDRAKQELAETRRWIDFYAEMGIPTIRVFAGSPAKGTPEDQAIGNIVANLGEALALAEARGVLLGLENHDFTTRIDRFLRIMQSIDSPWLGGTFDSGNLEPDPDPYGQMEQIAPYAITAQIKTTLKTATGKVPTDLTRVVSILKAANYRGYLVMEYEEENPYEAIPGIIGQLRQAWEKA